MYGLSILRRCEGSAVISTVGPYLSRGACLASCAGERPAVKQNSSRNRRIFMPERVARGGDIASGNLSTLRTGPGRVFGLQQDLSAGYKRSGRENIVGSDGAQG